MDFHPKIPLNWSKTANFLCTSLIRITFIGGSTSSCNSPVPASPRTGLGRCLSPLLIHYGCKSIPGPDSASNIGIPPASPLGAIQPDLYLKKDGPLFIGDTNNASHSLGRLHFRLSYDYDRSDFVVHLIEGEQTSLSMIIHQIL